MEHLKETGEPDKFGFHKCDFTKDFSFLHHPEGALEDGLIDNVFCIDRPEEISLIGDFST